MKAARPDTTSVVSARAGFLFAGLAIALFAQIVHAAPLITVSNLNDGGPGSLRQAIADVDTGGTIVFSVSGTIVLASGLIVDKSLTIDGGESITLSGDNAVRIFFVDTSGPVTFTGLTMQNGRADSTGGGAILNTGRLDVIDSNFISNRSVDSGGAIRSSSSTAALSISGSLFENNVAQGGNGGGAIYSDSTGGNPEFLQITDSILTNNHSDGNAGGAITILSTDLFTLTDSVITDNTIDSFLFPSAIYIQTGTSVVTGNCIMGNEDIALRENLGTMDATNNWWGSATGPSGLGSGTGDSVTGNVTYSPYLVEPILGCAAIDHFVGGTVSGLVGTGLILQNNGGDNLVIPTDGSFTFPTPVPVSNNYEVTVASQPDNPSQTCTVSNASGTISDAHVTDVVVNCMIDQFSVGGTVNGLSGDQVVLQNNGGDDRVITTNGSFTFTAQDDGTAYDVTVLTQPGSPSQTCTVSNASGTISDAHVTDVVVNCVTDQFSVGGTVNGLTGDQVVLQNNGGDDRVIITDGGFTFTAQDDGTAYDVTVLTQPGSPSQTCSITDGSGTLAGSDVNNVVVNCMIDQFSVGGTVNGLSGDQVVLQNNGGDDRVITTNGSFTFTAQDDGTAYDVTVLTQPGSPSQTCSITDGSGTLAGSDVNNVVVNCMIDQFSVGGTVNGLSGDQVVLQNNGGDDRVIITDGGFTFTAQDDGTAYDVTVLTQPGSPSQTCSVTDGSGTLAGSDVNNVVVNCVTDQFTVGGTVSGLTGDQVVLQNNGGDDQVITTDGSFTFTAQDDGTAYDVTVLTQPSEPIQTCSASNASGILAGSNISDIEITCSTEPPAVSLSITALDFGIVSMNDSVSETVTLTNTGTGDLIISYISDPDSPFAITGGSCLLLPMMLLPTESCEIEVAYEPTNKAVNFRSEIMIISNAASSPDTITILGAGEPIAVPAMSRLGLALLALLLIALAWYTNLPGRPENA